MFGECSSAFMQPLIAPEEHSSKFLRAATKYICPSFSPFLEGSEDQFTALSNNIKNNTNNGDCKLYWWMLEDEVEIGSVISGLNTR